MDFNSLNLLVILLIWRFRSRTLFLEFVSKAWHNGKARLMGVRQFSRVELMFWVWGVT